MKTDTLRIAQTHDTAGADFDKLAQEMSSFTDEQKRQSKAVSHFPPPVHTILKTNDKMKRVCDTYLLMPWLPPV